MDLEIIYRDEYLIAINKPHGLLVHRSKYAGEADEYALQKLRNQIEHYVFPCHRIDRKTSGVLLFSLNEEVNSLMQQQFQSNMVKKKYLAIVRGFTNDAGIIDYPLTNEKGKTQEAISEFKTLTQSEIDLAFGKFTTSRYSLVEVTPQTGRMHQIRKHFAHILHPIIGDRPHGCNKQNKLFKEKWNLTSMMLHASDLSFVHPITNQEILIPANESEEFKRMMKILNLNL
ncbi:MAG: pseudouridylate synthase [Salinivirgaceae bacterium]|nr:pseudouridylate synthase [Salinivirgaceae bacterium]